MIEFLYKHIAITYCNNIEIHIVIMAYFTILEELEIDGDRD